MATPKQVNGTGNGQLGKRKKTRGSKGSYLSKWLDKTMHHIQDSTPSMDTYDSFTTPHSTWQPGPFPNGFDSRYLYGCSAEPMSLPTLPTYCSPAAIPPFYTPEYRFVQSASKSIQVQRARQRRRNEHKAEEIQSTPLSTPNGTLNKSYLLAKNLTDSQDFASLPPIVTSVGDTTSNSDLNTNEKDDGSNARRFSDPCVQGLPDVARPANGEPDSGSENSSVSGSHVGSKLLACLVDQITSLKLANERLNKDLQETKVELNNMKHQNMIWQKASNTSINGTPNHSPLGANGMVNGNYSPGFMAELVREIRDAARMREEALYARVRSMVHDRNENNLSTADLKLSDRSLEDIKSSLRASEADKRRMMERIAKLEDELRLIKISNSTSPTDNCVTNGNAEDGDGEKIRLRKELADMRRQKQNAEENALKLERLVTQLRSKFNGLQLPPSATSGPESLASEAEHEPNGRTRRSSINSSGSTVVFGPVTDL